MLAASFEEGTDLLEGPHYSKIMCSFLTQGTERLQAEYEVTQIFCNETSS